MPRCPACQTKLPLLVVLGLNGKAERPCRKCGKRVRLSQTEPNREAAIALSFGIVILVAVVFVWEVWTGHLPPARTMFAMGGTIVAIVAIVGYTKLHLELAG